MRGCRGGFHRAIGRELRLGSLGRCTVEQDILVRFTKCLAQSAAQLAFLIPVVKQHAADNDHADGEQTDLKIAHA